MRVIVGDDLAEFAADWIAERAGQHERFAISLAGGSTPRAVYERLASMPLAWEKWHVWWGDERMVAADHDDSNERMAREAWLDHVAIPASQITPLRSLDTPLPERFQLVLLGIGTDGHTASLFPGDAGLEATEPIVQVERPDHPRLSLTYPVLNAAECVAFLASGEGKRDMLRRVVERDETLPAARVRVAETVVLADRAAAGELGTTPGC